MLILRVPLTILSILASYFFTYWVLGAFLYSSSGGNILLSLLSIGSAIYVGRVVWKSGERIPEGAGAAIALGAISFGAVCFCAGFFGPMIFAPSANQGPLLGIFITGPIGFVLGGFGGLIYYLYSKAR
jgi:predicted transporter